ncbi:MAG: ABC transporter ATP-binding protein [Thermomicrobiales bacterium]|nr:ABC transporter ATP-binding protein [Thermomicrobiales bacterium]
MSQQSTLTHATGNRHQRDGQPVDIQLRGVEKRFEGFHAVRGVDLDITSGELLVLLGPSGCGKTTTLNMLAGLETPTGGQIIFGDKIVNHLPPEERDIAMVFQSIALYPHLNVRENIGFALRTQKVDRSVVAERTVEVAGILGLTPMLDRKINQLSGGQRQRVAIAKALVRRPALFLLDEPFSSLDAELRRQMRSELIRIHREVETTMVFVTHDQEEAMAIADRIGVMNEGKLVQLGDPLDLYLRPVNTWIARFIGAHPINFLTGQASGNTISLLPGWTLELPAEVRARVSGDTVTLGVRPDYLQVERAPHAGSIAGTVHTRQILGTDVLYEIDAGDTLLRSVRSVTDVFTEGDQVHLSLDWNQVFVFDSQTEERVYPA